MVPLSGLSALVQAVPGFRVSETEHVAGELAEHAHEAMCFCLAVGGRFAELHRGRAVAMRPGALIVREPGDSHADRFERGGATCVNVEYVGGERGPAIATFGVIEGGPPVWMATRIRVALHANDALALEEACWAMVDACAPPLQGARPRWLGAVERLIVERFAERWSLAVLAAEVAIHPAHLARAYRRAHGTSVVAALLRRRVEVAAARLTAGRGSLSEVAISCGFYDQPHFTRIFRRATGLPPAAYRRAACSDRTRLAAP